MYWRQTQKEYETQKGAQNKHLMQQLVMSGEQPGILAYAEGEPAGWCALAPRETYDRLRRSRILKPVDDLRVWSVVCFFVRREFRRKGVTTGLLQAAIQHVRNQGGQILEGYPVDPGQSAMPDVFAYTGLRAAFDRAGFKEVLRRSPKRPILRYEIKDGC